MSEAIAVEQEPALSQGERAVNSFVAPSKTFHDIFRSRSWWLPYVIVVICGLLFCTAVVQKVGTQQLAQKAMEQRAEKTGQQVPPEQQAKMMGFTEMMFKVGLYSFPVVQLLWSCVLALLIWLGMNFILGGTSKWTAIYAMTMYAALPTCIRSLIATITIWFGNNDNFDLNNPVGTNAGYYMSAEGSKFLTSLLSSLDIFTIWYVVLLGLGGAILARVKPRNGILLVAGVWFVVILIKAALA